MSDFPTALKQLRQSKKMTQKELAAALNISLISIKRYETGTRKPNFSIMNKIESFFQVTSSYLNGETTTNNYDFYINYTDSKISEFKKKLDIIDERIKDIPAESRTSIYSALTCFSQLLADCPLTEYNYIEYSEMLDLLMNYLMGISTYFQRKYNPTANEKALFSLEEYFLQIQNILKEMEKLYMDYYKTTLSHDGDEDKS